MIVIKIGTSSLTSVAGQLDESAIESLAQQIAALKPQHNIIVVSSGAVAAGTEALDMESRPSRIQLLQAAASVGQSLLVNKWGRAFDKYNVKVGQVLLSQQDFIHREQYLNARNTLKQLIELGVVPIINENDATSVEELRLGDNDILAAMVATLVNATHLFLVTDIEYLYEYNGKNKKALKFVEQITPKILALGAGAGSKFASGGMATKLQAAQVAVNFGIECSIVSGQKENVFKDMLDGKDAGTRFKPKEKGVNSRRAWIAFGRPDNGEITVDDGAKEAIVSKGTSLLPAGITGCSGAFQIGDTVKITDLSGRIIAKGLTNYSSVELEKIKGLRSPDIQELYGDDFSEEAIHRDCLVLLV